MFPESLEIRIDKLTNRGVDWLVENYGDASEAAANGVLVVLVQLEQFLRGLPWWVVFLIVAGISWHSSRRIGLTFGLIVDRRARRTPVSG